MKKLHNLFFALLFLICAAAFADEHQRIDFAVTWIKLLEEGKYAEAQLGAKKGALPAQHKGLWDWYYYPWRAKRFHKPLPFRREIGLVQSKDAKTLLLLRCTPLVDNQIRSQPWTEGFIIEEESDGSCLIEQAFFSLDRTSKGECHLDLFKEWLTVPQALSAAADEEEQKFYLSFSQFCEKGEFGRIWEKIPTLQHYAYLDSVDENGNIIIGFHYRIDLSTLNYQSRLIYRGFYLLWVTCRLDDPAAGFTVTNRYQLRNDSFDDD